MEKIMFKLNSNITLEGSAFYDNATGNFLFSPDDPAPQRTARYRRYGVAQQMTDGTFDFVPQPKLRAQSTLIRKLPHGRVSKTKDGAVQLTLKVFSDEGLPMARTFLTESQEAAEAIREHQCNGRARSMKIQDNKTYIGV